MKIKRKYIIVFASAFVFLAACAALFYMKFRVKYDGEIGRAGGGLIKINRSAEGFPVVELDDKSDIYFALGFLHAQDRLPVIEYYRSIVSSESSSVISDPDAALILDRIVAAFRIESAAKACVDSLPEPSLLKLQKYVEGINFYRANFSYKEILSQNYKASDWTVGEVVAILYLFELSERVDNSREFKLVVEDFRISRLRDLFQKNSLSLYSPDESADVEALRSVFSVFSRYVGNYNRGISYVCKNQGGNFFGMKLESSAFLYPKWYPVSFVCGGKREDFVSIAGIPFPLHYSDGVKSYSVYGLPVDTMDFFRARISRKNNEIDYRMGSVSGHVSSSGAVAVRLAENGPVVSDLFSKMSYSPEDESVIVSPFEFPGSGYVHLLFSFADMPPSDLKKTLQSCDSFPKKIIISSSDISSVYQFGRYTQRTASDRVIRNDYSSGFSRQIFSQRNISAIEVVSDDSYDGSAELSGVIPWNRDRISSVTAILSSSSSAQDVMKGSFDSRSAEASVNKPVFESMLSSIPVTSSKLALVYFSNWDSKFDSAGVSPSIFESLYFNFLRGVFQDEMPLSFACVCENPYYLSPYFHQSFEKNLSPVFDDLLTSESREERDTLFNKVFIRTMRQMHRLYGPKMEEWRLDKINGSGKDYILNAGNLPRIKIFTPQGDPTSFNASYYSLDLSTGKMFIKRYTSLSVIFSGGMLLSCEYPVSVRLLSGFDEIRFGEYVEAGRAEKRHSLIIRPEVLR